MNDPTPSATSPPEEERGIRGSWLILGIFLLVVVAAGTAVWYRYQAGDQAVALWGPEHADRIRNAAEVSLANLQQEGEGRQVEVGGITDFVHIRRALLTDVHYRWDEPPGNSDPEYSLTFQNAAGDTTLRFDMEDSTIRLDETGAQVVLNPPLMRTFRKFFDAQLNRPR